MTELILGGTPVPELADNAVVFEEGEWRLVRHLSGGFYWQLMFYDMCRGHVSWRDGQWRIWLPDCGLQPVTCDLDQAIGALWAAREAS